ncbi:hypothetical protein LZC95_19920 [Pendulispora brunnea]|uniref:Uncharacterized protein n=1 Tax=Pendulispora brunnea TaxID=2905690 RepID=A0ABZ2KK82_9BACT
MGDVAAHERGGLDDRVRLELGGQEVVVAESYEVRAGILSQPAAFGVRLGHGDVAAKLFKKYPPKTPFRLYIGDVLQQCGETDGYRAESSVGATEVTLRGRDSLAPLYDGYVERERSYLDSTFSELVRSALREVGLDPAKLRTSGRADRSIRAGVPITELGPPRTVDEIALSSGGRAPNPSGETNYAASIQTKLGERWFEFLRRYLDRGGLFLWSSTDGGFVLSQPNANLKPTYRIVRQRGKHDNSVNVLHAELVHETTHRHSEVVIYGRGGGRKFGRTKSRGSFVDNEMWQGFRQGPEAAGGPDAQGYRRPLVLRDANVSTPGQAEFLALRRLAEERRAGWSLVYRLAGHTTPAIQGGGRAVWTFDTLVEVSDDEFDLHETFYIENVEYVRGSDGTTTTIRLMRLRDLVFGGIDE